MWAGWAGALLCAVCASVTGSRGQVSSLFTYAATILFAASVTVASRPCEALPHGERVIMTMGITDTPTATGRWTRATARIDKYRLYDRKAGTDGWRRADEKVIVRFDTSFRIAAGDRLIATGYASETGSGAYEGYARLMRRRGYTCSVWINDSQRVVTLPEKNRTPGMAASKIRAAAAERLSRLELPAGQAATAAAMSLGQRDALTPEMREEYSLTGASHLLAVSGLHVGIVALLVNLILYLLPSFRHGHIIKNAAAIAAIWAYALLTGLSASALRAAMMFTGAQIALAASRTGNSVNILLATATVMLLINPDYLYDPSFQLSFAAVAGIFVLYPSLYSSVASRFKTLNAFWALFMVGLAATVATAPLVSYHFGRIPIIGVLINPLLIITANITVLLSLWWILMPFEFLKGFFSAAIGFSTGLQNTIIESCSGKWWASLPLQLEMWQAAALYAAAAGLYFLLRQKLFRNKNPLISDSI